MLKLEAYSAFGDFSNAPPGSCRHALRPGAHAVQGLSWSLAAATHRTAAKLARRYWAAVDQPDRTLLISRTNGYHGRTASAPAWRHPANESASAHRWRPSRSARLAGAPSRNSAPRRGQGRGDLRGAGDRRRRRLPPMPATWRDAALCKRTACCCRRLRDLRLRRLGSWFVSSAGGSSRTDHLRQGRHQRLPAARRRDGAQRVAEPFWSRPASDLPPRAHLRRPRRLLCGGPGQHRAARRRLARARASSSSRLRHGQSLRRPSGRLGNPGVASASWPRSSSATRRSSAIRTPSTES